MVPVHQVKVLRKEIRVLAVENFAKLVETSKLVSALVKLF
jgi:hypothetical protein